MNGIEYYAALMLLVGALMLLPIFAGWLVDAIFSLVGYIHRR